MGAANQQDFSLKQFQNQPIMQTQIRNNTSNNAAQNMMYQQYTKMNNFLDNESSMKATQP